MATHFELVVRQVSDIEKTLIGFCGALLALLWGIHQFEIRALRKSLHDLRGDLPKIIVSWVEFVNKRGPPPNGNGK